MQNSVKNINTKMSAVIGLEIDKVEEAIGSKFESLSFFVPTYSYSSSSGYSNYMESGHVTAKYDNINVTLPIQILKPRSK